MFRSLFLSSRLSSSPSLFLKSSPYSQASNGHGGKSTPTKLSVYQSTSRDAIFNLAVEEWLFNEVLNPSESQQILYLWRNGPTVVIGKHQNPWKECSIPKMEKDGVTLMRRYSGGGAVYHDMGNGVFTFLSPKSQHDIPRNVGIVCGAMKRLGINAQPSGRNDVTVDGKKISGSAFKNAKDKSIHHGTFLYNVNMNALGRYLTPSRAKLMSKGVDSVAARVTNIRDLNPDVTFEQVNEALISQFLETYGGPKEIQVQDVSPVKLNDQPSFTRYYAQLSDWAWRFGKTPEFEHHLETRFDWGQFDVHIQSKSGVIDQVKIYSDSLNPSLVEELEKNLVGVHYSTSGVKEAGAKTKKALPTEAHSQVDQFTEWLAGSL